MVIQDNNIKLNPTKLSLGIFGLLFGTTALAGTALIAQPHATAEGDSTTATSKVSVNVSAVCNLSGTVTSAHTGTITPGQNFDPNQPGIGTTEMKATCNDGNGYGIYAIGFSGGSSGQTNSTKLVGANGNTATIDTADYNASPSNSYWSMKLTAGTGTDAATIENPYNNYKAIPANYTRVASKNSVTSSLDKDVVTTAFTTTYNAYATNTQASGSYTGQVKYVLVHPGSITPGTYTIAFNENGGDGSMPNQTTVSGTTDPLLNYDDQTINTMSGITAPSGYQFAGWCTAQDTSQTPQTTCSGTTYNDGGTVPASTVTANATLTLYAIWEEIPPMSSCPTSPMVSTVASGINYMQDINSSNIYTVLSKLTADATYQIKDNRDNETYCVSKLADGKLWMLDNLALDLTNETILNSLSSANTNIDSNNESAILTSLKSGNRTAGNQYATAGVANWTSSYSYSAPLVNLTNKDKVPTDATSTAGGYKVGGYYNYCAASAGSYCYGNGTSEGTSEGNASSSICPAGWRMPTDNTSGEFQNLYSNYYKTYADYRSALHLPLSGYFEDGVAKSQGSGGFFWSSTRNNDDYMYNRRLNTSSIYSVFAGSRLYGRSLRCVAGT